GAVPPRVPLAVARRRLLARWLARWSPDDPRATWLAATVLCAGAPARAADPDLLRQAAFAIAAVRSAAAPAADGGGGGRGGARERASGLGPRASGSGSIARHAPESAPSFSDPETREPEASTPEPATRSELRSAPSSPRVAEPEPSTPEP